MQREGYWDYMGRRTRERRIEDMRKHQPLADALQLMYLCEKSLEGYDKRIVELNDEIRELRESKFVSQQLEFKF